MKNLEIPPTQILALYASFSQPYMSFYRFDISNPSNYSSYFQNKQDEMQSLQSIIHLCHQNSILIQFHETPSIPALQRLYHYLFKKHSLSQTELSTAACFC